MYIVTTTLYKVRLYLISDDLFPKYPVVHLHADKRSFYSWRPALEYHSCALSLCNPRPRAPRMLHHRHVLPRGMPQLDAPQRAASSTCGCAAPSTG